MPTKGTFILHIGNSKQELPRYQDCPRCGSEESCIWSGVAYEQVCPTCLTDPEYIEEQEQRHQARRKGRGMDSAFANQKPSAVWDFKGRQLYTNPKGDIIKDEKARPLKTGRQKD